MAHFRATIKGQRGEASRLGSKKTGIRATVNGWNSGVYVHGGIDSQGNDEFVVTMTSGSGGGSSQEIGIIKMKKGKPVFVKTKNLTKNWSPIV